MLEGEIRGHRPPVWAANSLPSRILFHSDFDGICSAAVLFRFFSYDLELEPVDYSGATTWLHRRLDRAAVVDYLFHPQALWWFDHHTTSFASEILHDAYRPDSRHRWDTAYPSCPPLIFDVLGESEDVTAMRQEFDAWVHWCNIIDSAQYESPWQATKGDAPCLLINQGLIESADPELRKRLVVDIGRGTAPQEVSGRDYIRPLWSSFRGKVDAALAVVGEHLRKIGQVGLCDIADSDALFLRYGVYCFEPKLRFSVTAYDSQRIPRPYKISLSFNPWCSREKNSLNLGAMAREYGGGGRDNVASISFESAQECRLVAEEVALRLDREARA